MCVVYIHINVHIYVFISIMNSKDGHLKYIFKTRCHEMHMHQEGFRCDKNNISRQDIGLMKFTLIISQNL